MRRVREKMMRGFCLHRIPLAGLNAWPRPLFRPLCSSNGNKRADVSRRPDEDAYRQLENLDFMTAAKMLFTTPPKKKKFGLDFHLVQLFFACMPSLAVYLVAQYARYEIRRMEAELELKKKQAEEEEKAKEIESNTTEEEDSDSDLLKVKVRLDALEEAVKEIVDETKKLSSGITKDQEVSNKEQPTNPQTKSKASSPAADDQHSKSKAGESTPDTTRGKARESNATASIPGTT